MQSREWAEFLDDEPTVCVIHRVFIPCRHGKHGIHCVYSTDPDEVAAVRKYQNGG